MGYCTAIAKQLSDLESALQRLSNKPEIIALNHSQRSSFETKFYNYNEINTFYMIQKCSAYVDGHILSLKFLERLIFIV